MTVKVTGDLIYGRTNGLVRDIQSVLMKSPSNIILEMSDVKMMDSSGLRAILQCRRQCLDMGIAFKLQSVSPNVARIIDMSGLSRLFGLAKGAGHVPDAQSTSKQKSKYVQQEHVAPSEASVIGILRSKVTDAATAAGARGDTLADIQIAVGEALTNAYRHGSPKKSKNRIKLRFSTSPKAMVIEVEDEGAAFDPNATSEPDPRELRDHGMGIFLMRQAMDSVEFVSNSPGNIIRMVKWLTPETSEAA